MSPVIELTSFASSVFLFFERLAENVSDEWVNTSRGLVSLICGGLLVGFGMSLSGSCPGTVFVQAGASTRGWIFTMSGGIFGASLYSMMHTAKERSGLLHAFPVPLKVVPVPAFAVAAALMGVVLIAELLSPHEPSSHGFHPALCGVVLGLLQFPAAFDLNIH